MIIQRAVIFLIFLGFYIEGFSAESCSDQFPDGLQNSDSNGEIKFNWQAKLLNSPDNILDTQDLNDGSGGVSCDTTTCSASNNLVPKVNFATFAGGNDVNVGFAQTLTLSPGDYDNLSMSSQATLLLEPGIYTFDKQVNIGSQSTIELTEPGSVQFYVNNQVNFNNQTVINSQAGDHYFGLYANKNITLVSSMTFHGLIYGQGNITVQNNAAVSGAITGEKKIELISGATVTFDPSVLDGDYGEICEPAQMPDPILSYQMEDSNWNGSGNAGDVEDSSGNNLTGSSEGDVTLESSDPAITGDPGTCQYGNFDGSGSMLRSPDNSMLDFTDQVSIAAWVRPRSTGSESLGIIVGKGLYVDFSYRLRMSAGNRLEFIWCSNSGFFGCSTSQSVRSNVSDILPLNDWSHVAIAFEQGSQQLYINGVLSGSSTNNNDIVPNNYEFFVGGLDSFFYGYRYEFDGYIDEVRVYDEPLSASQVNQVMQETHPCPNAASVDHYAISGDTVALTCEPAQVDIVAHDASHNEVFPPAGLQLALSTVPGNNGWSGPLSGASGTLNGNIYTFPGGESGASFHLRKTSPVTGLQVNVQDDNGVTEFEDLVIDFESVGFRFINASENSIENKVAGQADTNVYLQAVKTDDSGACTGLFPNGGSQLVGLGAQCNNPTTCAGRNVQIENNGVSADISTFDNAASASYTPRTLLFGTDSKAQLGFKYKDVGQISLYAQHELLNEFGTATGEFISGISNQFVVRPYTLAVTQVESETGTANPGTEAAGIGFVAAGETFGLRVQAEDAEGDITPNYGRESTPEAVKLSPAVDLSYPVGGSTGVLGNSAEGFFTYLGSDGEFENTSLYWSEVGTMQVTALIADGDYLGAGDQISPQLSEKIGRFYPDKFILEADTDDIVDACSGYSYMSQNQIQAYFNIQAVNALPTPGITSNYDVPTLSWLDPATLASVAENGDDGIDLSDRAIIDVASSTWVNGEYIVDIDDAALLRKLDNSLDGPFLQLQLGVVLDDPSSDNRQLADLNMNPGIAGDCSATNSCLAKSVGSEIEAYFGRLVMKSAHGPETENLAVPMVTERHDGSSFQVAVQDTCTAIDVGAIEFEGSVIDESIAGRTVDLMGGATVGVFDNILLNLDNGLYEVLFSQGDAGFFFTAPGTGITDNDVLIDVNLTAYPWLLDDWDKDGDYNNQVLQPSITAQFVRYRGHDRIIYWRERF